MNKKISLLMIITMVFAIYVAQPRTASAIDLDDPSNIASQIWEASRDNVLAPVVKSISSKVLNKLSSDTISWANNGFDGDPGFINNWDGFLKGTEHEVISRAFQSSAKIASDASDVSQYRNNPEVQERYDSCLSETIAKAITAEENAITACEDNLGTDEECLQQGSDAYDNVLNAGRDNCQESVFTNNVGDLAEANYQRWNSGEIKNTRDIANSIAVYGAQKLTQDPVNSLISGQGETLTSLLGSEARKEAFKTDLSQGGWAGYLALADPHNHDLGRQSLVTGALGQQTDEKVSQTVQELQIPTTILSKKRCVEYSKTETNSDGSKVCLREEVTTPGAQVSAKLDAAFNSENEAIQFLSDNIGGALVSAVGQLTDGLISGGLSNLTSAATNAFFSPEDGDAREITNAAGTNYQSRYDVLGIENNSNVQPSANTNDTRDSGGGGIFGAPVDSSFIGGPEDREGVAWNEGPQVIVDFKQNLESSITLAEEELGYFREAETILDTAQGFAIDLDRCLPGPDYGWEKRYEDVFDVNGNDEDRFGLTETREMVNDPFVNIPGSEQMRSIFSQLAGGSNAERIQVENRIDLLESLLLSLKFIRQNIQEQFNDQRRNLGLNNLVLLREDWDALSQSQKENAAGHAIDGYEKIPGEAKTQFLILKEGETIDQILEVNPNKVRDAVISMSWDIWRSRTPKEDKSDLRYEYHIQQSNLSNNEFLARAKANLNRINSGALESEKILSDCLIIKSFALGTPVNELQTSVREGNTDNAVDKTISAALFAANPYLGIGKAIGLFGGAKGGYTFIQTKNEPKTNVEIKEFLLAEYEKTQDGNPNTTSLFQTNAVATPTAIGNSVLRFNDNELVTVSIQIEKGTERARPKYEEQDLPATVAYFQSKYPDFEFKKPIQENSYEIKDMFLKDRFYSSFNRARGERGILFCRNPRLVDLHDGSRDRFEPACIDEDWYGASNIDYKLLFSGVTTF